MIKLARRIDELMGVFAEGNDLPTISPLSSVAAEIPSFSTMRSAARSSDAAQSVESSSTVISSSSALPSSRLTKGPEAGSLNDVDAIPGIAERPIQRPRAVFPFPRSLMVKICKIVCKEGRNVARGLLC